MAPAPRKPALAIFDQPPLDTKNLIPMPEGVESFVMLSLSPAKALEAVSQIGPAGEVKEQIDELMEKVRSQSRIDFDKDFLATSAPGWPFTWSQGDRLPPPTRLHKPRPASPGSTRWPCFVPSRCIAQADPGGRTA